VKGLGDKIETSGDVLSSRIEQSRKKLMCEGL
jgi:hypothetical protein